jgi:nitrogen regulatory protein PII
MEKQYELIYTIVNQGYSDIVMQAAKENGARGGTIYLANGTGGKEYEKFYGIEISPEKEVIIIIVENKIKDKIMKAIYEVAGLETKGAGICFSMSLDDVYGISTSSQDVKE